MSDANTTPPASDAAENNNPGQGTATPSAYHPTVIADFKAKGLTDGQAEFAASLILPWRERRL